MLLIKLREKVRFEAMGCTTIDGMRVCGEIIKIIDSEIKDVADHVRDRADNLELDVSNFTDDELYIIDCEANDEAYYDDWYEDSLEEQIEKAKPHENNQ